MSYDISEQLIFAHRIIGQNLYFKKVFLKFISVDAVYPTPYISLIAHISRPQPD